MVLLRFQGEQKLICLLSFNMRSEIRRRFPNKALNTKSIFQISICKTHLESTWNCVSVEAFNANFNNFFLETFFSLFYFNTTLCRFYVNQMLQLSCQCFKQSLPLALFLFLFFSFSWLYLRNLINNIACFRQRLKIFPRWHLLNQS